MCIAGTITVLIPVPRAFANIVLAVSSAIPPANLPIILYVEGHTRRMVFDLSPSKRLICSILPVKLVIIGSSEAHSMVSFPMICVALSVNTTLILAPLLFRSLTMSGVL